MTDNERTPDQKRKWTEAEDLRGKAPPGRPIGNANR
jgi:hypothetical protein